MKQTDVQFSVFRMHVTQILKKFVKNENIISMTGI